MLGRQVKLVSCHLGGSSSMCAIDRGRSVDTTMGFSPQSGLENATRHGDLDVFAVLYMMERHGWSTEEVRTSLARGGGLTGLSGVPGGDVRDMEAAAAEGSRARGTGPRGLRLPGEEDHRSACGGHGRIGSRGVHGRHRRELRAAAVGAAARGWSSWDSSGRGAKNESGSGDRVVSAEDSPVAVLALATNEELIVARRAYARIMATDEHG